MTRGESRWLDTPMRLWHGSRKLRFLLIGAWNTGFGYLCFYVLYLLAADHLHYLAISAIAHFIAVTQSYAMHRRLVFHSVAPVIFEFLRFNASHLGTLTFGLLAMYLLVEIAAVPPLVAQAIAILTSVILSYVLHSRVSFGPPQNRKGPPS